MIVFFLFSLFLSLGFTPLIKQLAVFFGCVDVPSEPRKIHRNPTPLLGGLAIFLAFSITFLTAVFFGKVDLQILPIKFILGILSGGVILMLGGFLDDKYDLPPKVMWFFPGFAALVVVLSGVGTGIKFLTNPFGGVINLDYAYWGFPLSAIFTWAWLMVSTYTTKLLDGLDGLVSGIGLIAALVLFFLSLRPEVAQSSTALLALCLAGALLGFLPYAWHPARIFLGEGGSTFIGFILGVLAVLSGAKIATAVLVMGLPFLDAAFTVLRRILQGRSPFQGDRGHLHFRLLDAGLSTRQAVLLFWGISAIFGTGAVFLQTKGKAWLMALVLMLSITIFGLSFKKRKKEA